MLTRVPVRGATAREPAEELAGRQVMSALVTADRLTHLKESGGQCCFSVSCFCFSYFCLGLDYETFMVLPKYLVTENGYFLLCEPMIGEAAGCVCALLPRF